MPYSYGSYSPAYPTTGFGGYVPNVTVNTPGSGYVHQQHMSLLSSGDSSFNSSLGSSSSQGSFGSPNDFSLSPQSSDYTPSGYGALTSFAQYGSSSPSMQSPYPAEGYTSAAAAAAANTFMHTAPFSPNQATGPHPSLMHYGFKDTSLKDALAGLSALSN